ncbi:MAG: DUF3616 domain-containing protein [Verrucomicrobia bacterium]|nr:DUF3616 domain-containing protein [Verrucomicrobiota bacterium]
MRAIFLILCSLALGARAEEVLHLRRPASYSGMCDASGAVAVGTNLFLVANDEDNSLRLYRHDIPGEPVKSFNLDSFLELSGKSPEADLEAAARIGDRVFWIGSHGRNKDGKDRPNRCRFFATDLKLTGGEVAVTPAGRPCKTLLRDLINDPQFAAFDFAAAAALAPQSAGAPNIEGLAATPEGQLLIGFRNPSPQGKALLIPLLNPDEVISGRPAQFGVVIRLDLGGRGIRDIVRQGESYLIIAGPIDGGSDFQLYRWAGLGGRRRSARAGAGETS